MNKALVPMLLLLIAVIATYFIFFYKQISGILKKSGVNVQVIVKNKHGEFIYEFNPNVPMDIHEVGTNQTSIYITPVQGTYDTRDVYDYKISVYERQTLVAEKVYSSSFLTSKLTEENLF